MNDLDYLGDVSGFLGDHCLLRFVHHHFDLGRDVFFFLIARLRITYLKGRRGLAVQPALEQLTCLDAKQVFFVVFLELLLVFQHHPEDFGVEQSVDLIHVFVLGPLQVVVFHQAQNLVVHHFLNLLHLDVFALDRLPSQG